MMRAPEQLILQSTLVTLLTSLNYLGPAGAAQRPDTLPRPPGGWVGSLPRSRGDRASETSVAVNPRDPQHVLVSFQQPVPANRPLETPGRFEARVAWSADGGKTWTIATGTAPSNYLLSGDPTVAFDLHGHAFLAYLGFDKTGVRWYWGKGGSRNGTFVRRSLDGGRTWEASHTPLIEYPTMADPPWQDKGYLVADNNPSSPHAGNLYVGWTRYSLDKSEILLSRSIDDGKTWSEPMVISSDPGVPRGTHSGAVMGFHAAIGREGTVYAIWTDGQAIVLAVSRDGGGSFEPSRRVVTTTFWGFFATVTDFPGALGLPSIGIDPRSSPGKLFVSWGDYRYGDVDVLASTSEDGGRTWTTPVRVNDDPKHNGKDQVFPWLAVDPSDGAPHVIFHDRRADSNNVLPTVTLARSTDGGRTFVNYSWTVTPGDPKLAIFGDYIGLAALNGRVYGAWSENAREDGTIDGAEVNSRTGSGVAGPGAIRIGIADFRSVPRQ